MDVDDKDSFISNNNTCMDNFFLHVYLSLLLKLIAKLLNI